MSWCLKRGGTALFHSLLVESKCLVSHLADLLYFSLSLSLSVSYISPAPASHPSLFCVLHDITSEVINNVPIMYSFAILLFKWQTPYCVFLQIQQWCFSLLSPSLISPSIIASYQLSRFSVCMHIGSHGSRRNKSLTWSISLPFHIDYSSVVRRDGFHSSPLLFHK